MSEVIGAELAIRLMLVVGLVAAILWVKGV